MKATPEASSFPPLVTRIWVLLLLNAVLKVTTSPAPSVSVPPTPIAWLAGIRTFSPGATATEAPLAMVNPFGNT